MLSRAVIYACVFLLVGNIPSIGLAATTINDAAVNNANKLPPLTMSLAATVKKTLQQNPEVLKSGSTRLAAAAAIKQAKGGFLPKVDTAFGVGRSNTTVDYPTTKTQNSLNPGMTSVTITQPIFSGMSTYNLVEQRKEEFNSASFAEDFTKEDLALQAVYAYINVLYYERLHNLVIHNIGVHKEILTKVNLKYQGGAGTKADADLAAGRLAQKEARLYSIDGAKENSIANFLEVVGIKPPQLIIPTEIPTLPKSLSLAINMALEKNPTYYAALASFRAADKAVSVSKASLLPEINLQASHSYSNDYSGYKACNKDMRGMLVARFNLFNGSSDLSNIDRTTYVRQTAMYNLHSTKNKTIEKVTKIWNKLKSDELSLIANRNHLYAAEKTLYAYKLQFELGRNTLLNVLDMENEVFNTKVDVTSSEYSLIIDYYELLADIGTLKTYFEHVRKSNG